MSYRVEYIHCRICGSDLPRFLGIRGNFEFSGAPQPAPGQEHMFTNIVKCRKCGFIYTNPLIISDNAKRYNDPLEYKPTADGIEPSLLFRQALRLIERHIPKGKILDVGCGKGEFLAAARDQGWQAWGLEASEEFADYGRQKYNLDIRLKSLEDAGFCDSSFDAVTLNMALEHLDNPNSTLEGINRVLGKDGVLFIEVPNMDSLMLRLATLYFRLKGKNWSPMLSPLHYPFHCYGYNIKSLRYLLRSHNFRIKKVIFRDIGLRGMRHNPSVNPREKVLCWLAAKSSNFVGGGDILNVIAVKEKRG